MFLQFLLLSTPAAHKKALCKQSCHHLLMISGFLLHHCRKQKTPTMISLPTLLLSSNPIDFPSSFNRMHILRCQYILPQLPALLLMNYSAYGLLDVHEAFTFSTFMTFSFKIFTPFQNLSKNFSKMVMFLETTFFYFQKRKKAVRLFHLTA